jgi:hypothetical protein
VEAKVAAEIDEAAEEALVSHKERMPRPESAADGVYAEAQGQSGQQKKSIGITAED